MVLRARKSRKGRKSRKSKKSRKPKTQLLTADRSGYTATKIASKYPLPKTYKRSLPYFDGGYLINPTFGAAGAHTFRVNSLFDFDGTGGGHQYLGFDQLMLMYEHFTVIGFQCKVDIHSVEDIHHQIVGMYLSSDPFPEIDMRKIIENGDAVWQLLGPDGSGIESVCSLSIQCSVEKFLGISAIMSDNSMRGSASSSPTNGVYLHVVCVADDLTSDAAGVRFSMYSNAIAVFTEPKELDLS